MLAARFADMLPVIHGDHEAWRYTLISGVIPALPLILIRPFLPESPVWAAKKAAGTIGGTDKAIAALQALKRFEG